MNKFETRIAKRINSDMPGKKKPATITNPNQAFKYLKNHDYETGAIYLIPKGAFVACINEEYEIYFMGVDRLLQVANEEATITNPNQAFEYLKNHDYENGAIYLIPKGAFVACINEEYEVYFMGVNRLLQVANEEALDRSNDEEDDD